MSDINIYRINSFKDWEKLDVTKYKNSRRFFIRPKDSESRLYIHGFSHMYTENRYFIFPCYDGCDGELVFSGLKKL
jgi:hypothetical protein